jgi:hypothetical protein
VLYDGIEGAYLSAPAVGERYALLAGCDVDNPMAGADVDIVGNLDGAETSTTVWNDCLSGAQVEFWKINDGPHIPGPWVQDGLDLFVDWLLDRGRN